MTEHQPANATQGQPQGQSQGQPQGQVQGQYSPDGSHFWDGRQWVPVGGPPKKKHTLRNVLLVLAGLFILFVGGCMVLVGTAVNEVGKEVDKAAAQDKLPGGPDNPLAIREGEAFDVYGFEYQPGWRITKDIGGTLEIRGLKFENQRDEADSALVEIKFHRGNEVLASADCSSDEAEVGQIVSLTCLSGDKLPANYDKVTINDTF